MRVMATNESGVTAGSFDFEIPSIFFAQDVALFPYCSPCSCTRLLNF